MRSTSRQPGGKARAWSLSWCLRRGWVVLDGRICDEVQPPARAIDDRYSPSPSTPTVAWGAFRRNRGSGERHMGDLLNIGYALENSGCERSPPKVELRNQIGKTKCLEVCS